MRFNASTPSAPRILRGAYHQIVCFRLNFPSLGHRSDNFLRQNVRAH